MKLSSVIFACFVAAIVFTSTCKAQLSEVLMLTLSSGAKSDQTAVRFLAEATDSFNSEYDAYKLMNPNLTPNIYTVSDQEYAINALNNDFSEKIIDLHVRAAFPAVYTLTAEELGAFDSSWSIHLTDLFLNQEIDLRKIASYSFTADPKDAYQRFSLRFKKAEMKSLLITESSPQEQEDIDPTIYAHEDKIIVTTDGEAASAISINDLEGNSICLSEVPVETWTFSPEKTGIYVVHVSTPQHTYTKKLMICKN